MPFRITLGFLLLLASLARAAPAPAALLIVVGDAHSAYDQYPAFLAFVDHVRASHPGVPLGVLIDGDAFEFGNAVGRKTNGAIDFALLGELAERAPTVLNLGNHEADFMSLADAAAQLRGVGVTVISGNLRSRANDQPFAQAATELKLGTHTLTVVGIATDRLSTFRVAIRPTLDPADPVVWARQNFPLLLSRAAIPVVLSHAGLRADRQILPLVADGTLFIGAHDHLRFTHVEGRTLYLHSGSWLSHVSVVALHDEDGRVSWTVEQDPLNPLAPVDAPLAQMVRTTLQQHLGAEETAIVGRSAQAMTSEQAARFAVEAARVALKGDAAVIGGTTFGGGLPAGEISRYAFDGCVRFDGTLFSADVTGAELQRLLTNANQSDDTPWATRSNENLVAVGPAQIDPAKHYRLVTTDWIARNPKQYLGDQAPVFTEVPAQHLKAAVIAALRRK